MLKTRILTALVLVAGFLGILFLASDTTWALLTLIASLIGVWEWSNLIQLNKLQARVTLAVASGLGLALIFTSNISLAHYHDVVVFSILGISAIFWILIAPIWLSTRKKINHRFAMSMLGLLLLFATWIALIGLHNISPWLLLGVLATVWIADSAAYFAGKSFGRHKLAPEISPGKTWEGVAGAIVAVSLYGFLLCYYLNYSLWLIVGLWLIVVLSIMGDLFESLLKRQAGVKDSSQLLPGHGGVLDRIDGLIPSLALTLFYIYFPLFANLPLQA
ncbi:MAG TPA: phosphatidate cytidylyltransferase [Methylotenera sp.]|nr:phosphatidate cytidylyltransferase [Methylotenera sp.]